MAEVLGLMASIVALIQLTEVVTKTAQKHVNTVKGAHSVLVPVLGKLRSLGSILGALKAQLEVKIADFGESLSLQHLREPITICEDALISTKARLDNLKVIGGYVVGSILDKQTTLQVKRLEDLIPILHLALDVDNLVSTQAIEYHMQSLRLDGAKQMQSLHQDVQALHKDAMQWKLEVRELKNASSATQLRERILHWLAPSDQESNYRFACQRQQPGTGEWLLENKHFLDWDAGRNSCLWLHAMAGAGKTILASTVIRHLIARHTPASVAYFFFDFKDVVKQDVVSLLSSLLAQCCRTADPLPSALLSLFQRHSARDPDRPTSPTAWELVQVLMDVISAREDLFLVVDALDECRQRPLLLEVLETIANVFDNPSSRCRILYTSRVEVDIQRVFTKLRVIPLPVQNQHVDHDVALYVRAILETDDRLRAYRPEIKGLIVDTLTQGAKGMFRWVQCQVDHIRTLRTAKDIKLALQQLPPDLDQTYDNMLLSVRPADQGYLRRALQLLVFSARPLTLDEAAEAVIVEPGIEEIDKDARLQRPEDLLEIGKSLFVQEAITDCKPRLLELSHYSVKEYLLSERARQGPAAAFAIDEVQAELANVTCCLTYLGLNVFEDLWKDFDAKTWVQDDTQDSGVEEDFLTWQQYERLELYPFLDYAAKACFSHCRFEAVQKAVAPLVRKTLAGETSGKFRNMTYTCIFKPNESWQTLYMRVFRYSLISVAARYGLTIIVQDLLDHGIPADYLPLIPSWVEQYPEGQTALYRAADFRHSILCRILVEAGANVNGEHEYDCPLSAAGRGGNPAVVKILLDAGADVNKGANSIAETLLAIWWKYTEGDARWKDILDIFRDAGAKWLTIGLLAAFSRSMVPLINRVVELLGDEAGLPRGSLTLHNPFHQAVEDIEINTLNALQWLVQDNNGADGLKGCIEYLICAIYDSQPHLFKCNPKFSPPKYNTEEILAENLIRTYFQPIRTVDPESGWDAVEENSILTVRWDNVSSLSPTARQRMPFTMITSAEAEGLIVCGDILRAFIRDRWVHQYAHFFE
ncbi:hypothetical protein N7G274_000295 [Stereocaulon virgatum]|uniref:Nephrocystin 3-like N-terminal domain-containing protein n=1 Tax=Stereocaulon virgatum TaxID=373712 RepID=A0ABR4AS88_9LECA